MGAAQKKANQENHVGTHGTDFTFSGISGGAARGNAGLVLQSSKEVPQEKVGGSVGALGSTALKMVPALNIARAVFSLGFVIDM